VELRFLIGGEPNDAAAVAAFAADGAQPSCVLHPGFSDRAGLAYPGVASRAIGVDLVTMNGPEEDRAYREAAELTEAFQNRLTPVPFHGVDLSACAASLLGLRLDRTLTLAYAVNQLRAEGFGRIVIWIRNFARHYLPLLAEAEALGWGATGESLLRVRDGRIEPETPSLWARQAFEPTGRRVAMRFQDGPAPSLEEAVGGAAPAPGGLTIMLLTQSAGYLAEAAAVLEAADKAGLPYRLLCSEPRVIDALQQVMGPMPASAPQFILRPELGMRAMDPEGVCDALGALFGQFEALAVDPPTAMAPGPDGPDGEPPAETSGGDLGDRMLDFAFGCFAHASMHRRAWQRCIEIERMAAWLRHDDARRLFFYPARTHLDPAPHQMMAARGGWTASAIFRSITADYRNFHVPRADRLAVLGADQVGVAAGRGFPLAGLRPVGSPQADAAFAHAAPPPMTAKDAKTRTPTLLAATSGFDRAGEARWIPRMAEVARAGKIKLVLKPHPSLGAAAYRPLLGADDDAVRLEPAADIHALIDAADAVVTDVSHVGKLAVYRGKTLAVANLSGQPFPYNRFDELGIATLLDDERAVVAYAKAVGRGAAKAPDPERRAAFVRAEFTTDDRRSGERMVRFLAEPPRPGHGPSAGGGDGLAGAPPMAFAFLKAPNHPRAEWAAGLFRDAATFAEIEARIAESPQPEDRNDAFAAFVEGFLATQSMAQAEAIWPAGAVPAALRRALKLPRTGVHGVYRTRNGAYVAYRTRFEPGRRALSGRELSALFGKTDAGDRRALFTNAARVPAASRRRWTFHAVRAADFERLDQADLARIADWLGSGVPRPHARGPRPRQVEALRSIARGLRDAGRATVVMPAGTGKTLLSLWATEQADPKCVLVLVPSLAELRRTLRAWAASARWGDRFRYLCFCTDPPKAPAAEEPTPRPNELDFPVSAAPADITPFLRDSSGGVQVVFSTYRSAAAVARGMAPDDSFDFGVFDDADRHDGSAEEMLPRISSRLYLATTEPRPEDAARFGPVVHRLSFAAAADHGLLGAYKVVVSVGAGATAAEGDGAALRQAVEAIGAARIVTLHRNAREAERFAATAGALLPAFDAAHVDGRQSADDREDRLKAFGAADKALVATTRRLAEGAAAPATDMVAFMAPPRDKVDIAAAIGLAASAEKDCGYVVLPLVLARRDGESVEAALKRSRIDDVVRILRAVQELDDGFAAIVRALREARGCEGRLDLGPLAEKIVILGPQADLPALRGAIGARVIDRLGAGWDERLGALAAYKAAYGDCAVPSRWSSDPTLANWVRRQRGERRKGRLDAERIARLDRLGFRWSAKPGDG